jgi:hypothetical protein
MEAITQRFELESLMDVIKATSLLNLKNWPEIEKPCYKGLFLIVVSD